MTMPSGEYKLPPLSDFTVKEVHDYTTQPQILFREWIYAYGIDNQGDFPSYAYDHTNRVLYIFRRDKPTGMHVVDEDQYETVYVDDDPYEHVS